MVTGWQNRNGDFNLEVVFHGEPPPPPLASEEIDLLPHPASLRPLVDQSREGDVLIPKKHPSAFFATPLASHLIDLQADTLVVTGCTTSGCVRGSVVDAFAYNFRCLVPQDAVYDRSAVSHAVNLFDMASKYADVGTTTDILERLRPLRKAEAA